MRIIPVPPDWSDVVRIVADLADDDVPAWLSHREVDEMLRARRTIRRQEILASRIAAKAMAVDAGLVDDPARLTFARDGERPVALVDEAPAGLNVTFSHTAGIGGAALGSSPLGLDLEHPRTIEVRATKLFLTNEEFDAAMQRRVQNPLLHFWCAKEAAFKLQHKEPTLHKVALRLVSESDSGLVFEFDEGRVETTIIDGVLFAALARG